ncbi:MAG: hypothetical protein DMF58_02195 [Acidobacteria bacterium]|nr:MAG: hypothetical protein DMF58_02195 [Acidobacteriota bacterium]
MSGVAQKYPRGFLRSYVRAKLATDPVYDAAFECLRGSELPVLDIGCGVGILGMYLRERGFTAPIVGIDHDARFGAISFCSTCSTTSRTRIRRRFCAMRPKPV